MSVHPLISIITVTYNAAGVIEKTLDSLKEQSFKDFEHIVIDGASTDDTLSLVKGYGIGNTVIISEKDSGLYDAMNKGMRMAKGDFILFLNAGDRFHSSKTLENYANVTGPDTDIIYGDTDIVDVQGNFVSHRHLSAPENLTHKSFSKGMLICHQAFMVRRTMAPEYDLRYRFSSDYDWCVKCIGSSSSLRCIRIPDVTIDYLNDGLTDKNKLKSLKERFTIMTKHYGLPTTLMNHLGFVVRALRRGNL